MKQHVIGALAAICATTSLAAATDFPTEQVRIVVPYSAGGVTDFYARLIGAEISEIWGQDVVVDNVPGSGSLVGAAEVARADPDGHTILLGSYGLVSNQFLLPDAPYDPDSLNPVYMIGRSSNALFLHKDFPADTLEEVIEVARSRPGALKLASSGIGASPHIAAELFAEQIEAEILHVPYQGTAPAMTDVLAGRMDGIFDGISGYQHVRSGDLKAIAIARSERHPEAPDLPTFTELGMPFEFGAFFGFLVPAGTPQEVQDKLHADLREVVEREDISSQIEARGIRLSEFSQQEFEDFLQAEHAAIESLIDTGRLQIDN